MKNWKIDIHIARSRGKQSDLSTEERREFLRLLSSLEIKPHDCKFSWSSTSHVVEPSFERSAESRFAAQSVADALMKQLEKILDPGVYKITDFYVSEASDQILGAVHNFAPNFTVERDIPQAGIRSLASRALPQR